MLLIFGSSLLRGGCVLFLSCFGFLGVEPINPTDVRARNQVAVEIDRHLDTAVSQLVAHVGQACAGLDEKGSVSVTEIVNPEMSQARALDRWQEISRVNVTSVEWRPGFGSEN